MRVAIAQDNPVVGDLAGNAARLREHRALAAQQGCDLLITSELALSGYPIEDLAYHRGFIHAARRTAQDLAAEWTDEGPGVLLGLPWLDQDSLYNAALLIDGGEILAVTRKVRLPNAEVFDEKRTFTAGALPGPLRFREHNLGVMICEDMWDEEVAECLQESGADLLIVLNASPFARNKYDQRLQHALARVTETGLTLIYSNQVGGQDELVFDGASFVLNPDRALALQLPEFTPALAVCEIQRAAQNRLHQNPLHQDPLQGWVCRPQSLTPRAQDDLARTYRAVSLGLGDYVRKNGFGGVVLGLSGGIDSALTATLAVDALGAGRVRAFMMPSPYTSDQSCADAAMLAETLGINLATIPIDPGARGLIEMIEPMLGRPKGNNAQEATTPSWPENWGVTWENIQARLRGITLMAVANALGDLLLTTGNKSELAVGYATLYGDMAGGFAPLKDLYKTRVFDLARWRNAHYPDGALGPDGTVIPPSILARSPSAELRANQKDSDSLPDYEDLDGILIPMLELDETLAQMTARGFEHDLVRRVWQMVCRAEHKRRQAPPGVKLTARSFGKDRRYPITHRFELT
ncbi:MAG: NAD+ synthase [Pseudomonadota bacterium]